MEALQKTDGENSRSAKITAEIARHIVRCRKNGVSRKELAALFGICADTIDGIVSGRYWNKETRNVRVMIHVP